MTDATLNIVGRVGRKPSFREVGDREVCNFPVATSRKIKGEKVTTWFEVSCWDDRKNEVIRNWVEKGSLIMVTGEPGCRAWKTKDGEERASIECNISFGKLVLLGGGQVSDAAEPERPSQQAKASGSARSKRTTEVEIDDDIPF